MWKGRFEYMRKLIGSLLVFLAVCLALNQSLWNWWVLIGAFLFFEHYFIWDRWDAFDFLIGHEYWGLYLMVIGFLISHSWAALIMALCGFFGGARYEVFNPFSSLIPTIKEVFYG